MSDLKDRIARFREKVAVEWCNFPGRCVPPALDLLSDCQREMTWLEDGLQKLEKENNELEAEHRRQRERIEDLEQRLDSYICRVEQDLEPKNKQLASENKSFRIVVGNLEHELQVAFDAKAELKAENRKLREALDTAKAALHHCDIRHKKCSCSSEAIAEIAAALADKGGE